MLLEIKSGLRFWVFCSGSRFKILGTESKSGFRISVLKFSSGFRIVILEFSSGLRELDISPTNAGDSTRDWFELRRFILFI